MKSRKINRSKRVSHGCRNNGSCPYCRGSRTFSTRRQEPLPDKGEDLMDEFTEVTCTECKWSGLAGELDNSAYQPRIYDRCPDCGGDNVEDEEGNKARYEP